MTRKNQHLLLIFIGILSFSLYVGISYNQLGGFGFPLDDGWIHQTYARNFAENGEWAYVSGKTSGGSTSPLWTLTLSLVYLFNTGPFWGTFVLSMMLTLVAGLLFQYLFELNTHTNTKYVWLKGLPVFGLFYLLDWRMNWAAVSGMEIMLYIVVILAFFVALKKNKKYWIPGLLAGIALWIRPDGLTLLGPLFFVFFLEKPEKVARTKKILESLLAFSPFVIGYFIFNKLTAGTWLPNTFYAKQSEYAVLYQISLGKRILQLMGQPWISAAVVLLPGLLFMIYQSIKQKDWFNISKTLWAFGYILIYAIRLPVIYQHARYLMPAMPVLYYLGLLGTIEALSTMQLSDSKVKLLRFGVFTLLGCLLLGFWMLGLSAYISDTSIIHQEMVTASLWVRDNIPSNEVIAAHDIGALGYYGEHDILDLAGLISPDVIPFIRDEAKLEEYLKDQDVMYIMTLSNWYDSLTENAEVIYSSSGNAVIKAGGEPMEIYRYDWAGE